MPVSVCSDDPSDESLDPEVHLDQVVYRASMKSSSKYDSEIREK